MIKNIHVNCYFIKDLLHDDVIGGRSFTLDLFQTHNVQSHWEVLRMIKNIHVNGYFRRFLPLTQIHEPKPLGTENKKQKNIF